MSTPKMDEILDRLHTLQEDLETTIDQLLEEKRRQFRYELRRGRVQFEEEVKALHRRQRTALWAYLRSAQLASLLTAPVIYGLMVPLVTLDIAVTVYQHICFRVYGIPLVDRGDYLVIDRHHLLYLNIIEKLNCVYCGYANGLIAYTREIASRTEQFWCPIKHARRTPDPHRRVERFVDYGDAQAYKAQIESLRRQIARLRDEGSHRG